VTERDSGPVVQVRLQRPASEPVEQARETTGPQVFQPPDPLKARPVELAELPAAPPEAVPAEIRPQPPEHTAPRSLLLSRQFELDTAEPMFGAVEPTTDDRPDFYLRQRAVLEDVLNEPSLQLPFRDTRIYLVDSYSPGLGGSVERFWDGVTVPFGWTTKNNTRIQCSWVLILAGCSWGHVSLFHQKAKRRKEG
jgi:hypothetical protein